MMRCVLPCNAAARCSLPRAARATCSFPGAPGPCGRLRRPAAPVRRSLQMRALGDDETPDWLKSLEENAIDDDEVKDMLMEAKKDPKAFEKKVRERYVVSDEEMYKSRAMASDTMKVRFGSPFDPFDLWIWIEFETGPANEDQQMYLEEMLKAWFIVGRMGGYNSINLQLQRQANEAVGAPSVSGMTYQPAEGSETSLFHAMGDAEYRGRWARCWFDLGTSDEIALDILINTLTTLSDEYVGIRQVVIGGIQEEWKEGTKDMAQKMDSFSAPSGGGAASGR